jgi:hypothetical protein
MQLDRALKVDIYTSMHFSTLFLLQLYVLCFFEVVVIQDGTA